MISRLIYSEPHSHSLHRITSQDITKSLASILSLGTELAKHRYVNAMAGLSSKQFEFLDLENYGDDTVLKLVRIQA